MQMRVSTEAVSRALVSDFVSTSVKLAACISLSTISTGSIYPPAPPLSIPASERLGRLYKDESPTPQDWSD